MAALSLTIAAAVMIGCPAEDEGGTGNSGTAGDDDGASSMTTPADDGVDDGVTGGVDDGVDDGTATSGPSTMTAGDDDGVSDGPPMCPQEPQPDGGSCTEDCECESTHCFFIPGLGGLCGECTSDADCPEGGCTIPNPLAMPPVGSTCNMGEAGAGCETTEVCMEGLVCGTLLEVPMLLTLSTCGECTMDSDCTEAPNTLCSPTIDVANFAGQMLCVEPGSVPNGQACNHLGTGNEACNSGICATYDIMGIVTVGICGDCSVDADCDTGAGEVCLEPAIDTMTGEVTPPLCGPPP